MCTCVCVCVRTCMRMCMCRQGRAGQGKGKGRAEGCAGQCSAGQGRRARQGSHPPNRLSSTQVHLPFCCLMSCSYTRFVNKLKQQCRRPYFTFQTSPSGRARCWHNSKTSSRPLQRAKIRQVLQSRFLCWGPKAHS